MNELPFSMPDILTEHVPLYRLKVGKFLSLVRSECFEGFGELGKLSFVPILREFIEGTNGYVRSWLEDEMLGNMFDCDLQAAARAERRVVEALLEKKRTEAYHFRELAKYAQRVTRGGSDEYEALNRAAAGAYSVYRWLH